MVWHGSTLTKIESQASDSLPPDILLPMKLSMVVLYGWSVIAQSER